MSERTLGKARGLNSIADPSEFKGSRGRRRAPKVEETPPPPPPRFEDRTEDVDRDVTQADVNLDVGVDVDVDAAGSRPSMLEQAPAADTDRAGTPAAVSSEPERGARAPVTPHRAVVPGIRRKRRELSVPVPVSEALAATGINPADVVMSAYRKHSDAIFAGAGGRLLSRGRQRLRLSISDSEFDKLTRLGEARGWNRSETVAVLLTLELKLLDAPATSSDDPD